MSPEHLILLINPFIYDLCAFDFWAKPLGLLEVGLTLKQLGLQVETIDCMYSTDQDMAIFSKGRKEIALPRKKAFGSGTYFRERIEHPEIVCSIPRNVYRFGLHPEVLTAKLVNLPRKPSAIFVTGIMTYWWISLRDAIGLVKSVFPDVPVVLGGIYPTLMPEHARAHSGADIVVEGIAGDHVIADLIRNLLPGFEPEFHSTGEVIYYPYQNADYGIVRTSDGCPRKCSYCASGIIRPNYTEHDVEVTLRQILALYGYGIRNIAFYDDFLLHNRKNRLFPLLDRIGKFNLELNLLAPNGLFLDHIDQETADILKFSNFKTLRFGFETSNETLVRQTGYKISCEDFDRKIKILFKSGFRPDEIIIYLMVGLSGQTVDDVKETVGFINSYGLGICLSEFSPVPKTPEYGRALSESLVDFHEFPQYQNNSLLPMRSAVFTNEILNELKLLCHP